MRAVVAENRDLKVLKEKNELSKRQLEKEYEQLQRQDRQL